MLEDMAGNKLLVSQFYVTGQTACVKEAVG